ANESSGKVFLQLRCAIVDQPAILQRGIPAEDAALHGHVDADAVHVAELRFQIEKLGMDRRVAGPHRVLSTRVHSQAAAELGGNVVVFKIDDHSALSRANALWAANSKRNCRFVAIEWLFPLTSFDSPHP